MMLKKSLLLLIPLFLLLISCSNPETSENQTSTEENAASFPTEPAQAEQPTACTPGWKCISSKLKAYQDENCAVTQRQECNTLCVNGSCKAGEVCTTGFKCKNEFIKAYQLQSCSWIEEERCDWRCANNTCISKPENYTEGATEETPATSEQAEAQTEETTPPPAYPMLRYGETYSGELDGLSYNLSIFIIEAGRAQVRLNGYKSDWLHDGEQARLDGFDVIVHEVLYQQYSSGIKAITYTVE